MNTAPFNGPQRPYVSNSTASVRMFSNDWLEAMSKIHWAAVPVVFVPLILGMLVYSVRVDGLSYPLVVAYYAGGLAFWTLVEYVMHRFLFHCSPRIEWLRRIHHIFHGMHHDYPSDSRRLVMPPTVSLPVSLLFYGLFWLLLPAGTIKACFAGFATGYLIYDMVHYAVHHAIFQQPLLKALKRNHMQHHFADPTRSFGVSSPFWDVVFGTRRLTRRPG